MSWPAADVEVGEGLVRSLVAEQHPDLKGLPLVEFGAGWDNTLWRLGDDLLVRLPRRAMAARLTEHEQRWLPGLASRLPLPVPAPVRLGLPSSDYPWSWSIVPWLEGHSADLTPITKPNDAAERLGRFLRALHHQAPPEAPTNPFRGVPLRQRAGTFHQRLVQLAAEVDVQATQRVWELATAAGPWPNPPTWLHGDLHPANLLVSNGTLAAVIDFGDLCSGDPATDLAGSWMVLPASARPAFNAAYGDVGAELEARSLGWAVLFVLMLLGMGLDHRPTYLAAGRSTLARAIAHTDRSVVPLVGRDDDRKAGEAGGQHHVPEGRPPR